MDAADEIRALSAAHQAEIVAHGPFDKVDTSLFGGYRPRPDENVRLSRRERRGRVFGKRR